MKTKLNQILKRTVLVLRKPWMPFLTVRAFDLDHSKEEQRFYLIGFSSRRLLFVIYAEIGEIKDTIRLISARKAERKYQNEYVEANPEE